MPHDYRTYPSNWEAIKKTVLRRAQYRCEGSPAYPKCRAKHEELHPETSSLVILSVAHFDRDLGNNDLTNLRAWCQRCHLNHDISQHIESRKYGKEFRKRQLKLPFYYDFFIKIDAWLLRDYLNVYEVASLECDGQNRIFSYLLKQHNIPHTIKHGALSVNNESIEPHIWIEVHDIIVDYKARHWLGEDENIPHGCFYKKEYPNAIYSGDIANLDTSQQVFNILTMPLQEKLVLT